MEATRTTFRMSTGVGVLVAVWMIASMWNAKAQQGTPSISGTLLIQWVDGKRFIYVPDPNDGLRFHGGDGRDIVPKRMYTDGGSIPRLFWSVKGFSPWAMARPTCCTTGYFISIVAGTTKLPTTIRSPRPTRSLMMQSKS